MCVLMVDAVRAVVLLFVRCVPAVGSWCFLRICKDDVFFSRRVSGAIQFCSGGSAMDGWLSPRPGVARHYFEDGLSACGIEGIEPVDVSQHVDCDGETCELCRDMLDVRWRLGAGIERPGEVGQWLGVKWSKVRHFFAGRVCACGAHDESRVLEAQHQDLPVKSCTRCERALANLRAMNRGDGRG